ncbi:MAG: ATP-binding protein [Pseudomonadota bacterium]
MFAEIQSIASGAVDSDVFAAGIALGLIGLLAGLLHMWWSHLSAFAVRRLSVTLTVDNRTASFRHLMIWLEDSGALRGVRRVQFTDIALKERDIEAPAPGKHWFWRQGRLCRFERHLDTRARVSHSAGPKPLETIDLTIFLGRLQTIRSWIDEGARLDAQRQRIGPRLHVLRRDWWDQLGDIPARKLNSVLCDDDRIDRLAADVRWFYGSQAWYAQRGVPWRRGYLLYGPPGTGKSSVIRAIASEYGRDLAALDIGQPKLSDDDLREALFQAPEGSMIVIEDIDAVFRKRTGDTEGVSFSGLLNAIDGLAAQEGRALFMTTNHKDRLDAALIRPGRADLHVELGLLSGTAARVMFLRFFPEETRLADQFRQVIGDMSFSPAHLQGWLLRNAQDARTASLARGLSHTDQADAVAEKRAS